MKIHKNVIAMIVIMGITVIPTLYAWFNISASWDPYGNTGELKLIHEIHVDHTAFIHNDKFRLDGAFLAPLFLAGFSL